MKAAGGQPEIVRQVAALFALADQVEHRASQRQQSDVLNLG